MIHTGTKNKLSVLFHVTAATTWTQQSHHSASGGSGWNTRLRNKPISRLWWVYLSGSGWLEFGRDGIRHLVHSEVNRTLQKVRLVGPLLTEQHHLNQDRTDGNDGCQIFCKNLNASFCLAQIKSAQEVSMRMMENVIILNVTITKAEETVTAVWKHIIAGREPDVSCHQQWCTSASPLTSMNVSAQTLERTVKIALDLFFRRPTWHCSCQHSTRGHVCRKAAKRTVHIVKQSTGKPEASELKWKVLVLLVHQKCDNSKHEAKWTCLVPRQHVAQHCLSANKWF